MSSIYRTTERKKGYYVFRHTTLRIMNSIMQKCNGCCQDCSSSLPKNAQGETNNNKKIIFQLYLRTSLITYCMQHSPSSETNRFSASQEILRVLCNPKVHYRIYKYPPTVLILSQIDPIHTPQSNFLKFPLNIILLSMHLSPKWSLSTSFPHKNPTVLIQYKPKKCTFYKLIF